MVFFYKERNLFTQMLLVFFKDILSDEDFIMWKNLKMPTAYYFRWCDIGIGIRMTQILIKTQLVRLNNGIKKYRKDKIILIQSFCKAR